MSLDSFGSSLYSGASTVGVVGADMGLIVVLVVGALFMGITTYLWYTGQKINEQEGNKTVQTKVTGIGLSIVIAIVLAVVGLTYANWYFVNNYKAYAAVSGVGDVARMF